MNYVWLSLFIIVIIVNIFIIFGNLWDIVKGWFKHES